MAEFTENGILYSELVGEDEVLADPLGMRGPQARDAEVTKNSPQDLSGAKNLSEGAGEEFCDGNLTPNPRVENNSGNKNTGEKTKIAVTVVRSEDLKAIKELKARITLFESRCRAALSILDQETDKIITLV